MKTINRDSIWVPALLETLFLENMSDVPNNNKTFSAPAVNIIDNLTRFVVELAAPGFRKEDFSIEIEENILKTSAKISDKEEVTQEKDADSRYKRREFNLNSFSRSFRLPEDIHLEAIHASYENGILRISIPKKEDKKVLKKMVEIS